MMLRSGAPPRQLRNKFAKHICKASLRDAVANYGETVALQISITKSGMKKARSSFMKSRTV
jgi:hypothetical protein